VGNSPAEFGAPLRIQRNGCQPLEVRNNLFRALLTCTGIAWWASQATPMFTMMQVWLLAMVLLNKTFKQFSTLPHLPNAFVSKLYNMVLAKELRIHW